MSTALRDGSFRLWQQSERLHWGKTMRILMAVPCGANVRMLWNACMANNALLCRRDADQKYSVCRRNNRRLSKKGITRNAAGWCPQDSGRRGADGVPNAAEPFLFREDGIIRFPVKARKGCTRQNTDPSSRYGEFPAVCHVNYSDYVVFLPEEL